MSDKSVIKKPKVVTIGEYRLTGLTLGKGSYSTVREAIEITSNRKVALKIINIEADNYVKRNYKREAYILSLLNHENVVRMFEFLESPKRFIIVLELIPNNLCDFIRSQKRGKLDESFARVLFRQIISAIIYIHEKGIIHRDIKLENLLIDTKRNKIKLTDFGLSNEWDKKNLMLTICGSPEYSSPELHEGRPYGTEIDVWALGVVLFAMVVGRLPFDVEYKKPINSKHRRELFLDETRRGVKTVKHQSYMSSTSHCFKDLVSKLLNPNQQLRIKMKEVVKHDWIVFDKIDLGKMKKLPTRPHNSTTCGTSMKPGTAQVRNSTQQNVYRPITQANNGPNLRTTQKRFDKVK